MYTIAKTFEFSAAHHLPELPEGHKCRNQHGHNFAVTLVLAAEELDQYGFVMDYAGLASVREFIDNNLDHKDLNEVLEFDPTAESLAAWMYDVVRTGIPQLHTVVVQETGKTMAAYTPYDQPIVWTP